VARAFSCHGGAADGGHWYNSPGEVDVNSSFLSKTGLKVGDNFSFSVNGKPITVRMTWASSRRWG